MRTAIHVDECGNEGAKVTVIATLSRYDPVTKQNFQIFFERGYVSALKRTQVELEIEVWKAVQRLVDRILQNMENTING